MQNTNLEGLDIILDCSGGELFSSTYSMLNCLKQNGHCIEMETNELFSKIPSETNTFLKNCSLHRILLDQIVTAPTEIKEEISKLMLRGKIYTSTTLENKILVTRQKDGSL